MTQRRRQRATLFSGLMLLIGSFGLVGCSGGDDGAEEREWAESLQTVDGIESAESIDLGDRSSSRRAGEIKVSKSLTAEQAATIGKLSCEHERARFEEGTFLRMDVAGVSISATGDAHGCFTPDQLVLLTRAVGAADNAGFDGVISVKTSLNDSTFVWVIAAHADGEVVVDYLAALRGAVQDEELNFVGLVNAEYDVGSSSEIEGNPLVVQISPDYDLDPALSIAPAVLALDHRRVRLTDDGYDVHVGSLSEIESSEVSDIKQNADKAGVPMAVSLPLISDPEDTSADAAFIQDLQDHAGLSDMVFPYEDLEPYRLGPIELYLTSYEDFEPAIAVITDQSPEGVRLDLHGPDPDGFTVQFSWVPGLVQSSGAITNEALKLIEEGLPVTGLSFGLGSSEDENFVVVLMSNLAEDAQIETVRERLSPLAEDADVELIF